MVLRMHASDLRRQKETLYHSGNGSKAGMIDLLFDKKDESTLSTRLNA